MTVVGNMAAARTGAVGTGVPGAAPGAGAVADGFSEILSALAIAIDGDGTETVAEKGGKPTDAGALVLKFLVPGAANGNQPATGDGLVEAAATPQTSSVKAAKAQLLAGVNRPVGPEGPVAQQAPAAAECAPESIDLAEAEASGDTIDGKKPRTAGAEMTEDTVAPVSDAASLLALLGAPAAGGAPAREGRQEASGQTAAIRPQAPLPPEPKRAETLKDAGASFGALAASHAEARAAGEHATSGQTDSGSKDGRADAPLAAPSVDVTAAQQFPVSESMASAQPVHTAVPVVATADASAALSDTVIDMALGGQWIDRMATEISQLATGTGHSQFQLSPPNLGRIQVDVWQGVDGGQVRMLTETDEAATRLSEGAASLQADARLQSLALSTVTVARAPDGSFEGSRDANANAQQQQQQSQQSGASSMRQDGQPSTGQGTAGHAGTGGNGGNGAATGQQHGNMNDQGKASARAAVISERIDRADAELPRARPADASTIRYA